MFSTWNGSSMTCMFGAPLLGLGGDGPASLRGRRWGRGRRVAGGTTIAARTWIPGAQPTWAPARAAHARAHVERGTEERHIDLSRLEILRRQRDRRPEESRHARGNGNRPGIAFWVLRSIPRSNEGCEIGVRVQMNDRVLGPLDHVLWRSLRLLGGSRCGRRCLCRRIRWRCVSLRPRRRGLLLNGWRLIGGNPAERNIRGGRHEQGDKDHNQQIAHVIPPQQY